MTAIARAEKPVGQPRAHRWRKTAQRVVAVVLLAGAVWAGYEHRSQLSSAGRILSHVGLTWLGVAVLAEAASMVVFARLQRWLLRAGGVEISLVPMIEVTLAGNAMSTSLPGGAAWSATWAFGQLRRRGANRTLAGWVILVAGALASFAVFVIVAAGSWVAGNKGPVAQLRWVAAILAAIPVVVAVVWTATRRSGALRRRLQSAWGSLAARSGAARWIGGLIRRTVRSLGLVRPGPVGWIEAFGLAMANWLFDAACLVACTDALHVPVPWRGVLVVYGLTQITASLPVTPGGLGVVEGSMSALLVAYGTPTAEALAVVLLYRIVSFWGLVPVGWATWLGLELAGRQGLRQRAHPWARHRHGPEPTPLEPAVAPERVLALRPCTGNPENVYGDDGTAHPETTAGPVRRASLLGRGTVRR